MRTFVPRTLAAATVACACSVANAGVTVSPMVGQLLFDNDMSLDNEFYGSLGLGYQTDGPLGFELSYLASRPVPEFGDEEVDITIASLDVLYHFNQGESVQPYVLIGGGLINYNPGITEDFESSVFNAGAGLKAQIFGGLSLRSEFRLINDMDLELTDYAIGLGFLYEFGKKSNAKPAAVVTPPPPMDSDGDGVVDSADLCPGTPAGKTVDVNGCVMVLDDDMDGVVNGVDQCPDTSAGASVDEMGCYIVITETKEVNLYVVFANNSNEVPSSSYNEIKEIADFMTQFPLTKVEIAGHTDSSGSAAYNQTLSQKRAEAVAKVLINEFGVPATRVSAVGYGESQPIVDNDTAANRAKNRRVTASVSANVETIQK